MRMLSAAAAPLAAAAGARTETLPPLPHAVDASGCAPRTQGRAVAMGHPACTPALNLAPPPATAPGPFSASAERAAQLRSSGPAQQGG